MVTQTLPTEDVLARWRPGSYDWDWPSEWADIVQHDAGITVATLIKDIAANGVTTPVLLGDDGRVWDGRHRLLVARLLGIETLPVEYGHDGAVYKFLGKDTTSDRRSPRVLRQIFNLARMIRRILRGEAGRMNDGDW